LIAIIVACLLFIVALTIAIMLAYRHRDELKETGRRLFGIVAAKLKNQQKKIPIDDSN